MSRKYGQKGYQDDARRQPRSERVVREPTEGPRGRGLGAPSTTVLRCRRCAAVVEGADALGLDATCEGCGADLHTCTHCAHFDTSSPFECREAIPRRIESKTSRNQCELFKIKWTQEFSKEAESRTDAAKAFDDLFNF